MKWYSYLPFLDEHTYERYLPTAFDESMTLLQKVNKVIEGLNTVIQAMNKTFEEVDKQNDKITAIRDEFETLKEWLENEGLQERVVWVLNEWFDSGKLAQIINNDVFNMKADKETFEQFVVSITAQLEQTEQDLTAQLEQTEQDLTAQLEQTEQDLSSQLQQTEKTLHGHLAQTENEIPVTAYMSDEEREDIKREEPLLDHSASIQAYVDAMADKNIFGLYFPTGNYRFNNINLKSHSWAITGSFVASGYIHKTHFHIINGLNSVAFYGENRRISFSNFNTFSEGSKEDGLNVGFYKNNINNGAFVTVLNTRIRHFSGVCIDFVDGIDSTFENISASDNNMVFNINKDQWVGSTTITLKKVYAERNNSVINAPFCHQSKMDDVIFEYNKTIGNITKGSWTLDNVYLENNEAPLDATDSLLTKLYIYSMTANDGILNTQPNVSNVDKGDSNLNWKGLNASKVEYDTMHPRTIFTGNYTADSWIKLGRWESFSNGGRLQIKMLGGNGWLQTATGFDAPVGETTIDLLHAINTSSDLPNTLGFAYHTGGGKPLVEVKVKAIQPEWRDKFDIYVKVPSNARYVSADYKVVQGIFIKDLVLNVPYPGDNDRNVHGVKMAHNIQTDTGSFGIKDNGQLDMKAPITGGGTMPTNVTKYLPVIVNGVSYNIPLL